MMTSTLARRFTAALLSLLMAATLSAAAPGGVEAKEKEKDKDKGAPGGLFVPPDVSDLVLRSGRARVIVEVQTPAAHRPEGHLTPGLVNAQRVQIRVAQMQVLNRLRGLSYRLLRLYDTVPLLALEIGPDALTALRGAPQVQSVIGDSMNHPLLRDSIPLVQANQLWAGGIDGSGLTVAVIDTGVEASHPFFGGRVVEEACYSSTVPGVSVSLCPDGTEAQTGAGAAAPCSLDGCFHGTHVAGIAAGNGATAGQSFSGVAKGASIMAVQVFSRFDNPSDCGGLAPCAGAWTSDLIAGLERVYALRGTYNFASVNLSLGGGQFGSTCDGEPEKPIIDHLRSVGIATVVAAGNDGLTSALSSPGCISSAVSVGSTSKSDEISWFSNVASFLSLLAPGEDILSSVTDGVFDVLSGTSMATPHVAGAFVLLKQAVPGATVDQMLTALQASGLPIADTRPGGTVTKPRIRIAEALALLEPGTPILTSVAPMYSPPGTTPTVVIHGLNLESGATVSFGAGVTVVGATVDSPTQITASLSISLSATLGPRTVVVTNPGGLSGSLPDGFTVGAPDLSETAVSNPPVAAAAGTSFAVTDTVQNVGSVATPATTTRYYLSVDSVKNAGDVLLGGSRAVPALNAGAVSTGTVNVTIPFGTPSGTYVLLACADETGVVPEGNESNNCVASAGTVQVVLPDLVENTVSNPPATALAGAVFAVTDTTRNAGLLAAAGSTTRYYLSLDSVKNAGDVLLTGTRGVPALNAGATSTGTVNVVIPAGTPAGTYMLLACADDLGAVAETDETNNCVASAGTVQVGLPDLIETGVSNPPATAVVGTVFSVTDTVQNVGAVTAGGSITRYYLSLDSVKNAGDVLLTGTRGVATLSGGATSTGTVNVVIPSGTPSGTYVLLACADDLSAVAESNEANNCVASTSTVQVGAPPAPDLVQTSVSNPPATAVVGTAFSVTDTAQNTGGATAGASTTRYYLSLDTVKSASDVLLTGTRAVPALSAGVSSTGATSVTIPGPTAVGTYFVLACADDLGAVTESNEGNNCVASAGTVQVTVPAVADLVQTSVSNPPATAAAGASFSVTDTVQNIGTATAGASTTRYYLSLDSLKSASDILLTGSRSVGTLDAGVTSTGSATVTIPGGTAAGTYVLLACGDDLGAVTESNEANNCVGSSGTVQIGAANGVDLVETTVSNPPAAVLPGAFFSVTDTARNVGALTAGGTTTRYYLSLDTVKNAGDLLLTGTRGVPSLAPGAISTGTVNVVVPATTPLATYFMLACADDLAAVTESDETNNCVASATTVQVGRPDLVETLVSNPPATATVGTVFAVTDTVQNQGPVAASGTTTRYYLSIDGVKNTGDVLLTGSRGVGTLNGGVSSTGTVNVVIPSGTAPATYVLLACADDFSAVTEGNETNNCVASTGQVTVN